MLCKATCKRARSQCFSHRVVNKWNSSTQEILQATTVEQWLTNKKKKQQRWKELERSKI